MPFPDRSFKFDGDDHHLALPLNDIPKVALVNQMMQMWTSFLRAASYGEGPGERIIAYKLLPQNPVSILQVSSFI